MSDAAEFSRAYKVTEIKSKEFEFTWRLNNFKYMRGTCNILNTSARVHGLRVWQVSLNPKENYNATTNSITVEVVFDKDLLGIHRVAHWFAIYMLCNDGVEKKVHSSHGDPLVGPVIIGYENELFVEEKGWLCNGDLILRFEIRFVGEHEERPPSSYFQKPITRPVFPGLQPIFNDQLFSDVKLIVTSDNKKKVIYAYKGILTAQSPVFKAMFSHEMMEQHSSIVHITDVEFDVMKDMIWFMYGCDLKMDDKKARALLAAAEKYQYITLKRYCEVLLINEMNITNVIGLLVLSETYNADVLQRSALDFFSIHSQEFFQNDRLKEALITGLLPSMPDVLSSLVRRVGCAPAVR